MPRSASAGASARRATRFNAPRGSPAASARAAAVISESIRIPSNLSLHSSDPALNLSDDQHHGERRKNVRALEDGVKSHGLRPSFPAGLVWCSNRRPSLSAPWLRSFVSLDRSNAYSAQAAARSLCAKAEIMAERVGFEPTLGFPLNTLSKRAPSTTRPSLRLRCSPTLNRISRGAGWHHSSRAQVVQEYLLSLPDDGCYSPSAISQRLD